MGARSLAVIAATCAAAVVAPGQAQELRTPSTMIFMEVPLDAKSPREQMPNFGLQLQGSRPYQSLRIDQRTLHSFNFLPDGIEATWLVAGAVGSGGVFTMTIAPEASWRAL